MKIVGTVVDVGRLNVWIEVPFLGTVKIPLHCFKYEQKIGNIIGINFDFEMPERLDKL